MPRLATEDSWEDKQSSNGFSSLHYLVLVLCVNLPRSDVFEQQGEGFRGGVTCGQVERGHLL